jgi:zinc protease
MGWGYDTNKTDKGEGMRLIYKRIFMAVVGLLALWVGFVGTARGTEVLRATLKNGLRVVIVRNDLAPVVTTMVNYLVGSNEAPAGFPGMAHAQEHMMFRGNPGLSAAQLANLIAAMGGRFNADTQQTVTQYFFTVPAEDLEVALRIEAIRMRDVLDSEELWSKERGAIEQEVAQDISNPMYIFYMKLLQKMFAGTPYAHDALGTRPSFQKTTGNMLKAFYDAWYLPNNAIMVIVGDVDAHETLSMVSSLFEDIPSNPLPSRRSMHLKPLKGGTIEQETDLPYGLGIVAYRLPGYDSPDFAAAQILADILDSERGNLYALVPQGKALGAGFTTNFLPKAGLGYAFVAFPHGKDGSNLVSMVKGVISGYLKEGIPPDLVEASKRHAVADAAFRTNSVPELAAEWSQALAVEGRSAPDENIEAIKRVTVEDVNRVARKYLINETAISGMLRPRAAGKAQASHTFRGKESFAPKETKRVTLPEWATKTLVAARVPASNVSPIVKVLPNGLRLIVQKETISPTISVYGMVKHNAKLQTPKGKEGVAELLSDLFSYGTTTLDRLAFQKAVDDISARVSAGTDFSLQVLTDHFDRGVELLADNLLHPALPEAAFKVVQEETKGVVAGRLESPHYLFRRALSKALYPEGDPALRQPTPQSVTSITLDDVKAYHRNVFRPDLTVMVIIGNVTVDQAEATIEKYFGHWKAVGPKPVTDLPAVPLNEPSESAVPDASRVQDAVVLAETVGLTRSHPDYYALQVGNHVLSGAFYATRLYHDLREKASLVYTVESLLDVGKTRSTFQVFYACDPPNVSRASNLVKRDLHRMQTSPVTPAELQQAKTLLLKEIPLSESSFEGIGRKLLYLALLDLPLDEPIHAANRYREITAEEVQALFAKWIRPEDFVQVSLGPKPK